MSKLADLRIRQLDEALTPFREAKSRPVPREGWARAVRTALGMSLRQVARRAGMSKTAVQSVELNEAKGTVQLDSLKTVAEALDCDLVYALVPRRGTLAATLDRRAEDLAEGIVGRVSDSMDLEAQGISVSERARQVQELKEEILRERGRDFWDD